MTLDSNTDYIDAPIGKSGLQGGIILGLVGIVFNLVLYFSGIITEQWAAWLGLPLVLVVLFILQKKFRDGEQKGFISFGKAWKLGFLIYAVSTVLSSIFTYILYTMDGSLTETILERSYEEMAKSGMPDSQIDQAMEVTEMFVNPTSMAIMVVIVGLIGGLVFPLITSAIVKRNHPLD